MNLSRRHLLEAAASLGLAAAGGSVVRAASPAGAAPAALIGAWELETFTIDTPGAERPRFGPHPAGYLLYTPSGRMAAVLMAAHRDKLEAPNGGTSSRAELDESLGNFLSYAGTYEVRGNHVFHHVEVSVFTNLVGTTLERAFVLDGDTLTIRTLPPEIWGTSNRLTWKRT
jgi:Lipocalin-like domain